MKRETVLNLDDHLTETEKEDFTAGMGKALGCKLVESLREYY